MVAEEEEKVVGEKRWARLPAVAARCPTDGPFAGAHDTQITGSLSSCCTPVSSTCNTTKSTHCPDMVVTAKGDTFHPAPV